jgi:bifunctional DNA-binding transcriptional regulator/antitoxin component of YhaV-PrlF toxin-antitoxin module
MKQWTLPIKEDDDGELILEFPDELMEEVEWKIGDVIEWTDYGDGTWVLRKTVKL